MALDRLTKIDGGGISTTSDYRVGVITATKFVGPIEGSITATDATFSGNVSIAGTLTYEDVINVDSVGIGTFREGIFLPDNKKLQFGNAAGSADLEIFHSSSENKTIIDNNTNDLDIASDVIRLKNSARSETLATFIGNGGVSLYYDNSIKLSTAGWGIQATGILKIADATNSSGATNHLALGSSNDLKLFHDGSHNRIHGSTGFLDINNSADLISITASNRIDISDDFIRLRSRDGSDVYMTGTVNSSVDLYFNGTKKFETTSAGSKISGNLELSSTYPSLTWTDTNHNSDFRITNDDGKLIVYDITRGAHVLDFLANGDLHVRGDKGIYFGESNDLLIGHDGSSTRIDDNFGYLNIRSNILELKSMTGSELYAKFVVNGAAELYHNNSKKFETTNSGVTVTGGVTASGFTLGDNQNMQFGASNDLRIFHNGSHSYIADVGTGDLRITGSAVHIQNAAQSENMIRCFENAQVELYYDNSKKFQTTSSGATVTGQLFATSGFKVNDGVHITLGTDNDFKFYHDGTNAAWLNTSGNNYLYGSGGNFFIRPVNGESSIDAIANGAVKLYHDGTKRIETTSSGASVTGNLDIREAHNTAYSATASPNAFTVGNINSSANTNFTGIHLFTDGNGRGVVNLNALNNSATASADFTIQTRHAGTLGERFRITSTGHTRIENNLNALAALNTASNYHLHLSNPANDVGEAVGICFGLSTGRDIGASIYHSRTGSNSYGDLMFATKPSGGGVTERLRITSAGRVGIGSDTPVAHLDVANYQNIEVLRLRDRHFNKYLTIRGGGTPNRMVIDSYEGGGGGAAIDLASNGSTKLRVTTGGEVLIGTTTDANVKLDVEGSLRAKAANYVAPASGTGLEIYYANSALNDAPSGYLLCYDRSSSAYKKINYDASEHKFRTSGTERLLITSAGNVGINDTNPNAIFSVKLNGLPGTLADNSYQLRYASRNGNNASGYTASGLGIYGTADNSNGDKHTTYLYFGSRDPALNGSHGAGAWITMSNPDSQGSYGTGQLDFYVRNSAAYSFPNDPAATSGYWMSSLFRIKSNTQVQLPINGQQLTFGSSQQIKFYYENSEERMYLQGDGAYGMAFRVNSGNRIEINKTTGDVVMQGASGRNFQWDNSEASLYLTDNGSGSATLKIGTGGDLKIYHDAGNNTNYITASTNGEIKISGGVTFYDYTGTTKRAVIDSDGLRIGAASAPTLPTTGVQPMIMRNATHFTKEIHRTISDYRQICDGSHSGYLLLVPAYPGSGTTAGKKFYGTITYDRGSTGSGNSTNVSTVHASVGYNDDQFYVENVRNSQYATLPAKVTYNGTQYLALKFGSSGGGPIYGIHIDGLLRGNDSNFGRMVRTNEVDSVQNDTHGAIANHNAQYPICGVMVVDMDGTPLNDNSIRYMRGGTIHFEYSPAQTDCYDNGIFTARVNGIYHVTAGVLTGNNVGRVEFSIQRKVSGGSFQNVVNFNGAGNFSNSHNGPTATGFIKMKAGWQLRVYRVSSNQGAYGATHANNYFGAVLMHGLMDSQI